MSELALRLYPDLGKESADYFCGPGDYQPIINHLGTPVVQVDDDDYQGDTRALLKSGDRYGVLVFGWGSCSGCDALQGCSTIGEVGELIEDLSKDVKWFDSARDALTYFQTHDWEGDYSWHADEMRDFIAKAKAHLGAQVTDL